MSKIKLLLDVVSDLRSLADSLQAVADAVAKNGQEQPAQATEEQSVQKLEKNSNIENCIKAASLMGEILWGFLYAWRR